jgi:hypothetical protein
MEAQGRQDRQQLTQLKQMVVGTLGYTPQGFDSATTVSQVTQMSTGLLDPSTEAVIVNQITRQQQRQSLNSHFHRE